MADDVGEGIEEALNLVVTTEKSGNMKKQLKETIYETVSTLRDLFDKMKNNCDEKSSIISNLEAEVTQTDTLCFSLSVTPNEGSWILDLPPKSSYATQEIRI
jgi:Ni,Fe-hydrogenase III component G